MSKRGALVFSPLIIGMLMARAHAIGLGEIRTSSAINEPFHAEITLTGAGGISEQELILGLASNEEFVRAGVDRDFILQALRFRVDLESSPPRVVVTSTIPFKEPYLNFLVSAQWPQGGLIREYTVLLDLPVDRVHHTATPATVPSLGTTVEQRADEAAATGIEPGDDIYGPVVSGDSAWTLASRMQRPAGMSVHRLIDAIVALNPGAFAGGDRNRLRVGQLLVLPVGVSMAASQAVPQTGATDTPVETAARVAAPLPDPDVENRVPASTLASTDDIGRARREAEAEAAALAAEVAAKEARVADMQKTLDSQAAEILRLQQAIEAAPGQATDVSGAPVDMAAIDAAAAEAAARHEKDQVAIQALQAQVERAETEKTEALARLAGAAAEKQSLVAAQQATEGSAKAGWIAAVVAGIGLTLSLAYGFIGAQRRRADIEQSIQSLRQRLQGEGASAPADQDASDWADIQQNNAGEPEDAVLGVARTVALVTSKEVSAKVADEAGQAGLADIVFGPMGHSVVAADAVAEVDDRQEDGEELFGEQQEDLPEPVDFFPTLDLDALGDGHQPLAVADDETTAVEDEFALDETGDEPALADDQDGIDTDDDALPVREEPADEPDGDVGFVDDANTKLSLAEAYITMGDKDGAKELLMEVVDDAEAVADVDGVAACVAKARNILASIGA